LDPDIHADRLSRLLELIFNEEMQVQGSLKEESAKASVYSKKTIVDILARLKNSGIVNTEIQVAAQEFIVNRMNIYTSDIIMLQYSVMNGEKKSKVDFTNIPMSYGVVFMKESPSLFKNNESFIHYKKECTDTGIDLPMLSKIVYIELDKCLQILQEGRCPKQQEELCLWLAFMADVNSEYAIKLAESRAEFKNIRQELYMMSKNREEMLAMLADKYEEAIRFSELEEAKRSGEQKFGELTIKLLSLGRQDEIRKAVENKEYLEKLYKEFDMFT